MWNLLDSIWVQIYAEVHMSKYNNVKFLCINWNKKTKKTSH